MATQTFSVVIADSGANISTSEAAAFALDIAQLIEKRYKNNSEVTDVVVTYAADNILIRIT